MPEAVPQKPVPQALREAALRDAAFEAGLAASRAQFRGLLAVLTGPRPR